MENITLVVESDSTKLSLVPRERVHLGNDVFGLCITDLGGFTGIVVTVKQWEEMKRKVDNYVLKLRNFDK
jgi:hypothetical protein